MVIGSNKGEDDLRMKRILSIFVLLVLILTMVAPVMAAAEDDNLASMKGSMPNPIDYDLGVMSSLVGNSRAAVSGNKFGVKFNKYAVIIGISDYASIPGYPPGVEDLKNPANNAVQMKQVLMAQYGFVEQNIFMLLDGDATALGIAQAITWLAYNTNDHSSVLLFYSGHGGYAPDFWGLDADVEVDGYDEGIVSHDHYPIADGVLKAWLSNVKARKFSMIFDSCYSGGLFDDDDDLQAEGRVIVSACKADQLTYDIPWWENTLWGYYFIDQAIEKELAELRRPGISIEEAYEYAAPICEAFVAALGLPPCQPQIYDGYPAALIP